LNGIGNGNNSGGGLWLLDVYQLEGIRP